MQAMIITYFGKQFVKIAQGDMVLAINPVSKDSKSGISARFGADIALSSLSHPDYNGMSQVVHGEREPFAVRGPGDYEIKEIFIKGVMSGSPEISNKKYVNTVYSLSLDGINLAFLGIPGEGELEKDAREAVDNADVLFIPVGKSSAKLASSLEPKLIIPTDYDPSSLKSFLKEVGDEKAEVTDKLVLKRKDLEGKEGEIVVLRPA